MMATTHGYAGIAIAAIVATGWPEFGIVAAVGGIVGGLVPDLDVAWTHRRTLHFPVYYSLAAGGASVVAVLAPTVWTVGLAVGLIAAAVHAVSDVFGGSADPVPWESSSTRAVFVHPLDQWIHARGWIQYDGSPSDFLLCCLLAAPGVVVFQESTAIVALAAAGLVVSLLYTVFRKRIGRYVARHHHDQSLGPDPERAE